MKTFIAQNTFSHIKKLVLAAFLLLPISCNDKKQHSVPAVTTSVNKAQGLSDPYSEIRTVKLSLPSGKLIDTRLAISEAEQTIGLSGKKSEEMTKFEGLLFFYLNDGRRQFWMPDTYFNIHIIFLDKEMRIVGMEKNVPHHIGRQEPPKIYRTRSYIARHVLEIRADSPLGEELEQGTQFGWNSKISLLETELRIRQKQ